MDINQVIRAASEAPQFRQILQAAQQELTDVAPEQIDELIRLIEFALKNPDKYPEVRRAAIADDMADPKDLPQQFDAATLASVLVVLYKLRDMGGNEPMPMARGGLSHMRTLARQGRLGDTMLAHISPEEAAMLRARGGAGTINPNTGLPQYFSLKKFLKVVLPIALTFIAPGIGTAIGTALGATGAAASALGGAVLGGLTSGLTGGDVLQGALLGGLGGGLGGYVGGGVNEALNLGLGQTGQAILGGALVGGVSGAATGQGFGKGALTGALGAGVGEFAGQMGGELGGRLGSSVAAGGQQFGRALTAGFKPAEALASGALSGLATAATYKPIEPYTGTGLKTKPSDAVLQSLKVPTTDNVGYSPTNVDYSLVGSAPAPGMEGAMGTGVRMSTVDTAPSLKGASTLPNPLNLKNLGTLALIGSMAAGQRPPEVEQAIQTLPPAQQEYFNRPSIQWDWQRMQNDANAKNISLSDFMATYWPQITAGNYNMPTETTSPPPPMRRGGVYAMGGPLGVVARLARGSGSGRDDTINARLSDGEYVMDAETVAMLGDGSTEAGARRLDAMREQLRKHKGKTLARGKFSPNAKSPLAYLKGVV